MPTAPVPLFGPIPGGMEMVVILLIAVLLFGANKIPKLARSTGQAMGEFQKGRQEVEEELQEMQEPGLDTESDTTSTASSDLEGDSESSLESDSGLDTESETSSS